MKKLLGIIFLCFLWSSFSFAKIIIPTHNWTSQIVGAYVIGGIFEELGYPVKYKNADSNKEAIKLLPEIITFLGSVSAAEGRALNDRDAATELTKLADIAEEIKKKITKY